MELTVVVPCRNQAATLSQQLDALAAQSWGGRWEVVLADNGSTDATAAIARSHAGLAGRLRLVDASGGRGVGYTRRAGVAASSARAVAFCDGDDTVGDGWVAAIGNALASHDLVSGANELELLNSAELASQRGQARPGAPNYAGLPFLRGNNCGITRVAWDRLDGFDDSFHGLEDIEMSLRATALGYAVHFEPKAVVHYRYRTDWRGTWRQGLFYGGSDPQLRARARQLGIALAPSTEWKSWAYLVTHVPLLVRADVRRRWWWTLACRVGALRTRVRTATR